jgi:hypothetical protein
VTPPLLGPSVVLLAHERLSDLVDELQRKVGARSFGSPNGDAPVTVGVVERRVLALATAARDMLRGGAPVALRPGPVLRPSMGRFSVLGTTGFDLAGLAQGGAGPAWRTTLLRGGNPDPDLAEVVTRSAQFALAVGRNGLARTAVAVERDRIRAYTMGMLCTLAGEVVTGPLRRDLQAQRTRREPAPGHPAVEIGLARAQLLGLLLGPGADTRWGSWSPAAAEVPAALLEGYRVAYLEVFGEDKNRPVGFAAFEASLLEEGELTEERLRAAQESIAAGAAIADWSWPRWLLVLSPALLAPPVGLVLARLLPGSAAFTTTGASVTERSVYELLSVAAGVGALAPFGWSMWLWSQVPEHDASFITAAVLFGLRLAAAVTTVATSGTELHPLVRWLLLLAPQLGTDVYAGVAGLVALGGGRRGDAFVNLLQTLPLATALLDLGIAAVLKAIDNDTVWWIVVVALTLLLLLLVGIPLAFALQHSFTIDTLFTDSLPVLDALRAGGVGGLTALARVFDESTLWNDPTVAAPTLAVARYPSGARPLLRLWADPDAALAVAAHGDTVTITRGDGSTVDVRLPAGGATAAEVVPLLDGAVPGLHAEQTGPADPAYRLPWPETFADPGDLRPTLAEHDAHAGDILPLPDSSEDAVLLRHAPRWGWATTFGVAAPTSSRLDGYPLVPEVALGELDDSGMGMAGDLAALLCMAAASHLAPAPLTVAPSPGLPLPADPALRPVFQVFRQWNLDARRLNEWRMVVAGGAASEKGGAPASRDPTMVPTPPLGYASPTPAGEPVTNALGWVGTLRAWRRMAADLTTDTGAATRMPYTPAPPGGAGAVPPTNRELSDAIRFLLDLVP